MVYQWRIPKYKVDARTAAVELRRIEERCRVLRPKDVVEESRAEDAPLHGCFTWEDAAAAEKYRLRQAGDLIRSLRVVQFGCPPVNAFHSIRDEGTRQRGYRSVDLVLSDPELRELPKERAFRAATVAVERHGAISDLTGAYRRVEILRDPAPAGEEGPSALPSKRVK